MVSALQLGDIWGRGETHWRRVSEYLLPSKPLCVLAHECALLTSSEKEPSGLEAASEGTGHPQPGRCPEALRLAPFLTMQDSAGKGDFLVDVRSGGFWG